MLALVAATLLLFFVIVVGLWWLFPEEIGMRDCGEGERLKRHEVSVGGGSWSFIHVRLLVHFFVRKQGFPKGL